MNRVLIVAMFVCILTTGCSINMKWEPPVVCDHPMGECDDKR